MIAQQEVWPTKAKEASSPHEVRLTWLDTNPVFQCLKVTNQIIRHINQRGQIIEKQIIAQTPLPTCIFNIHIV